MMSKASTSVAHRSLPGGVFALFLCVTSLRVGLFLFPHNSQTSPSPWLSAHLPGIEEQKEVLNDEQKDIEKLLTIVGARQAWGEKEKRTENLEDRNQARNQSRLEKLALARATNDGFAEYFQARKESQAQRRKDRKWAQGLPGAKQAHSKYEQRMCDLEARKQGREQRRLEKHALARKTKEDFAQYFEARKEAQAERQKVRNWAQSLPGATQAHTEHDQRMQEFEARKQARKESRLEKHAFAQATKDGFAQYFQVRKEAQAHRPEGRNWAQGLPGATQAQSEHIQRMQEFEARKQARKESRLEKHAFAQVTKDGFAQYFQARIETQTQRRQGMNWARGLPGATQAHSEHEQRMQYFEARKQSRKERRLERYVFAQATKDGFAYYSQRRNDRKWSQGLPGVRQAYSEHKQRMQEFEARNQARKERRHEKHALAQATKDGFAQYFQARNEAQTKRRKENNWAQDLPGATQAHIEHDQRMQEFEARKNARGESRLEKHTVAQATKDGFAQYFHARKEAKAQGRKNRNWAQDLPRVRQAGMDHEQRMHEFEARKQARKEHRLAKHALAQTTKAAFAHYFQIRKEVHVQRKNDRKWAQGLPGATQAHSEHDQRMQEFEARMQARKESRFEKHALAQATKDDFAQYFQARKEAQAQQRKDRNWAQGLPGATWAHTEHEQRMQDLVARKQVREQSRLEKNALARATMDGFAQYFQARKEFQAQRRKDRKWAQGLPGAKQAHTEHEQRMWDLEARKARKQARKGNRLKNRA